LFFIRNKREYCQSRITKSQPDYAEFGGFCLAAAICNIRFLVDRCTRYVTNASAGMGVAGVYRGTIVGRDVFCVGVVLLVGTIDECGFCFYGSVFDADCRDYAWCFGWRNDYGLALRRDGINIGRGVFGKGVVSRMALLAFS